MFKFLLKWVSCRRAWRYYRVGDIAPDSLMNRAPGSPNIGAFVSVNPTSRRIEAIFVP